MSDDKLDRYDLEKVIKVLKQVIKGAPKSFLGETGSAVWYEIVPLEVALRKLEKQLKRAKEGI